MDKINLVKDTIDKSDIDYLAKCRTSATIGNIMNKKWLYNQYIILGKSQNDIANQLNCSRSIIKNLIKKYKIKITEEEKNKKIAKKLTGNTNGKNNKFSIEYIKKYISENSDGYLLLDSKYAGNRDPIKILCNKNHIYTTSFSNFQQRCRCPICARNQKLTIKDIKNFININSPGYILLSKKYINNRHKLKFKCPENHIFYMPFADFQQGQRCRICYHENRKYKIENIQQWVIENEPNYTLLSKKYEGYNKKLIWKCPKGHKFLMTFYAFKDSGYRCPICCQFVSAISQRLFWKVYNKIKNKFKNIYFAELNYEYRIKTLKFYRFLDFYIKDTNKCIEFDGDYWHRNKQKDLIREKQILKTNPTIQILHIKEKEYNLDKNLIVSKCINFIEGN